MKAIFIDIDNTLLDFDAYVKDGMRRGFAEYGLPEYEPYMYDIFKNVNDKLWHDIELGRITFTELKKIRWNRVFEALGFEADGVSFEQYFRDQLRESAIPVHGAYELLEALSGRCILCTASNGPYEQQMHRMELADMSRFFEHHFISEDLGASKPSREFYDAAFARLNEGRSTEDRIMPEETLMLGDSLTSDMTGGLNYGMKTCWYRRDTSKPMPEEWASRLDLIVDDLADAADAVKRI